MTRRARIGAVLGTVLFFALPGAAEAQGFFAGGSIGVAIGMTGGHMTQGRLTQEFGYHLGNQPDGLHIGATITESFGNDFFVLEIGPRAGYDYTVVDRPTVDLLLGPSLSLGFALAHKDPAFFVEPAFDVKLAFAGGRVVAFFRPVAVDLLVLGNNGQDSAEARWNLMWGAYGTF